MTLDEMAQKHFVGGLLVGDFAVPNSVPSSITDHAMRTVVEAVIGVHDVDRQWPVDVGRVGDTLDVLGKLDDVGGATALHALMHDFVERDGRARRLGAVMAVVTVVQRRIAAQTRAAEQMAHALERYAAARSDADRVLRLLPEPT